MEQYDTLYKILLLGDGLVAKTGILKRFIEGKFYDNPKGTVGVDFAAKILEMKNGRKIKLQIWDTVGQDRYRVSIGNYFKGTHGIILIYDITNKKTFQNLINWMEFIRKNTSSTIPIFLVGNKMDDEEHRQVAIEEGEEFAKKNELMFSECSAKTGKNVNYIFEKLAKTIDDKEEQERK